MYSTCLFCHASLGTNDVVEHFPVGRRLAFDAARGRLWVVCRHCERWNLTPIEERWEAIEECEKLFRATTLRMSTEHIGLARLREGLELVRIGEPQRPEMAAWRYGDQFGRRRRKFVAYAAGAVVVGGVLIAGGVEMGIFAGAGVNLMNVVNFTGSSVWKRRTAAYVPTPDGFVRVARGHIPTVRIVSGGDGAPVLQFDRRLRPGERSTRIRWWQFDPVPRSMFSHRSLISGKRVEIPLAESAPALAALLPVINGHGGSQQAVSRAVGLLESRRTDDLLRDAAASRARAWAGRLPGQISQLPAELRLALEMATHEDQERAALEGELASLEERWREAEEIAGIADNLFTAPSVSSSLAELKHDAEAASDVGNSTPPTGTNQ